MPTLATPKSIEAFAVGLCCFALSTLVGCGSGEASNSNAQVLFSGSVSGLAANESVIITGTIQATNQSVVVNATTNGPFNTSITLPAGTSFSSAGSASIKITNEPTGKTCTLGSSQFLLSQTNTISVVCKPNNPAGLYFGKLGTAAGTANLLILNNGSYWMWIGNTSGADNIIYGLVQGNSSTSTATNYSASGGVDIFSTPLITDFELSGAYKSGATFMGAASQGGRASALSLTVPNSISYTFAALADPFNYFDVAGTYSLTLVSALSSTNSSFVIDNAGAVSGKTQTGCSFSGIAKQKTTGENVMDLSLTLGPAPCVVPNTQMTGVAFLTKNTSGTQLIGGVLNGGRTSGLVLVAKKN